MRRIYGTGLATQRQSVEVREGVVKIGPNEPCPCGSGLKYKKCCRNVSGLKGWWRRRKAERAKRKALQS